jgi:myo-inositol 2-dehydrogenase/D-chiro-inositol 1-dehydrogenase
MKRTVLGVIGAGRIGKVHIENITRSIPQAELKYVFNPHQDKYNDWAKEQGCPLACADYKQILSDPEVNAVVICAPVAVHGDLVIESAVAGKHIFCEKPFDYSVDKILEATKTVEEKGVKLQLGFHRRFGGRIAKAKEFIATGKAGDIHIIKITSRNHMPPVASYFTASGGGGEQCSIYGDTTIHDFDMARFLNASEVVEVYAMGSKKIPKDRLASTADDTCIVSLRFEDNSLCVIDNSWEAVYGDDQRIEVFGNKGKIMVENIDFCPTTLYCQDGVHFTNNVPVTLMERHGKAYTEEMFQFVMAVQNNTPVPVTGKDGLLATIIAIAALKSAEEDRPVKIAELMPKL